MTRRGHFLFIALLLALFGSVRVWADGNTGSSADQSPLESPDYRLRHHEHEKAHKTPTPAPIPVTPTPTPFPRLIVGGGVGMAWPFSGWNSTYSSGTGFSADIGFAIDHQWVVGLGLSSFNFSGSIYGVPLSYQDVRGNVMVRYFLTPAKIHPYLTLRAGEIWQTATAENQSIKSYFPELNVGAGVELDLDYWASLYAEATCDMIFISSNDYATDIPLVLGLRLKI